MCVILAQRILKVVFLLIDDLSPFRLLLAAENPTCIIFGFYDKYPKNRNIDMVDLRRAAAARNNQIVEFDIGLFVQIFSDYRTDCSFAYASFHFGVLEQCFQKKQGNNEQENPKDT